MAPRRPIGTGNILADTRLRSLKPQDRLCKVNDRDRLYVAVTLSEAREQLGEIKKRCL